MSLTTLLPLLRQRLLAVLLLLVAAPAWAAPLGTAFTYQGQLSLDGSPVDGSYDFEFRLCDAASGGFPTATRIAEDVAVSAGLFRAEVDYTDLPFRSGTQFWIEVGVRSGSSLGSFTTLAPRQQLDGVPYAINARSVRAGSIDEFALANGAVTAAAILDGAVGNSKLALDAVGNLQLADGAVTTSKLAIGAVESNRIAIGAVDATRLADGAVGTSKLADQSVTEIKIADGAVSSAKLATDTVTSVQLATAAVTTPKLADGAITSAKVADGSITAAKLAFVAGDIDAVIAGTGLTGGATSGAATLAVDFTVAQARINGSCAANEYISAIAANGSVSCAAMPGATRTVVLDAADAGSFASLAIGGDGIPVVAYYDASGQNLRVARCANATCSGSPSLATVDSAGNVGTHTAIAIGLDGFPVIAYRNGGAGTLKVAKCADAGCSAATVNTVDASGDVGTFTDILVPADGQPVISYYDVGNSALKIARCANAACSGAASLATVDGAGATDVGQYSSIVLSPTTGAPLVVYYDVTNQDLKLAACSTNACTATLSLRTVVSSNALGSYASLVIDANGFPAIAYRNITNQSLDFTRCSTYDCATGSTTTRIVDDGGNVGVHASLVVAPDGVPFMAYQDAGGNDLRSAKCGSLNCDQPTLGALDIVGNVGEYAAAAIGSDGLPLIAYYDATNGDLKLVHCGTRACL
jgi:hypothetical protein